ncbi:MAG: hypothetical protein ICV84_11205, partial [Flavisolibacter sp.]|nr:hypothetical protein [Flavisolibacter sp.]
MKTFFVILFFIAWCTGVAQTVTIHNPGEVIHVARYSYYLEDPSGKHTIEDVLKSGAAGEFKKLNKPLVNFSVTASAFWIKCSIRNETAEKLLLELGNTTLYDIRLYEFDSGRLVAQHQAGTRFPFHQREVNDMRYRFELAAPPGATETLLLRVQNYRGTQFPLVVGTKVAFYNKGNSQYFLRGIYYGFMLLMVLYNLFIYFTLRDSSYIYYVLYVFFMGLWNASIDGYTFKYLWPSVPFLNQYTDVLVVFVSMAIISFATNFLNTRQGAPVLHKLLLGLLLCYTIILLIIVSGSFVMGTIL